MIPERGTSFRGWRLEDFLELACAIEDRERRLIGRNAFILFIQLSAELSDSESEASFDTDSPMYQHRHLQSPEVVRDIMGSIGQRRFKKENQRGAQPDGRSKEFASRRIATFQ